ncbi:AAA family ATPase [Flavobacterium sp. MAH-1]|uniref:AAA family ATPase n=1 Tax=Flavobacterium agri TaxID=2743471 RepID=A0A7Y9C8U1_9FLAO|nr:AAA family ATPase [Flavobacterium agri]NUY82730.1 AAA family ATPase [Flavobacterium agri]NYA72753.1 AAA family ATPase [Flavobacterium agri]
MNDNIKINTLARYIEENLRVSDQTSLNYIDPRGHVSRLNSKQNQIIFGRRGSGKSLLVRTLKRDTSNSVFIKVNIEDYKDISFPDSIIQVYRSFFRQLQKEINENPEWFQFLKKYNGKKLSSEIQKILNEMQAQLTTPDIYDENVKKTNSEKAGGNFKTNALGSEFGGNAEASQSTEIQKSVRIEKLNRLKIQLSEMKELVNKVSKFLNSKHIFLVLDDFYFIRKNDQANFIDLFHRLSKDTEVYLKIATIKHLSTLYSQTNGSISGIEIGHDAQSIELDYTLDQFQALSNFMRELLNQANTNSNAGVDLRQLISDNAFKQLCLASGGVPRDFLSLFIKLCNRAVNNNSSISKTDVNDIAIENYPNKLDNFKHDSAEEKELLEYYLKFLRKFTLTDKNTNIFLVSNNDLGDYSQIKQAIKELVDLRLIHLVDANTSSAPSDGKRYSAYMIDIGLYPNSRPRNFNQIEPGQTDDAGRRDQIRSAPKISLQDFKKYIDDLRLTQVLEETD